MIVFCEMAKECLWMQLYKKSSMPKRARIIFVFKVSGRNENETGNTKKLSMMHRNNPFIPFNNIMPA